MISMSPEAQAKLEECKRNHYLLEEIQIAVDFLGSASLFAARVKRRLDKGDHGVILHDKAFIDKLAAWRNTSALRSIPLAAEEGRKKRCPEILVNDATEDLHRLSEAWVNASRHFIGHPDADVQTVTEILNRL